MDFLKTLLLYMSLTVAGAVQEGPLPADVPTPTPEPTAIVETVEETPSLAVDVIVATAAPQPTATLPAGPTITPDTSYTNVKQGDRGDKVLSLQRRLIELGYLPEGADDGAFGGQTRRAVIAFQTANGLTADGVAGDATQTYLYQNPDVITAFTPEPTQAPTPTPTQAPVTIAPATQAPAAEVPATEVPATEAPETEAPATDAPATDAPATAVPATEAPVAETPATDAPTAEPVTAESPTEAPATEAPAADAPATEAPATDAPTAEPEASPVEDVTIAPPQAVPVLTAPPTSEEAEAALGLDRQMDAAIVFSHSGYELSARRLVEGVYEEFIPHIWLNEQGGAVVSLQEMMECVDGWQMTAQGDTLTLSAEDYVVAFDLTQTPVACTVDGEAVELPAGALRLHEGSLYASEAFLQTVFHAATFWDDDEATLIIAIPDKAAAQAAD